MSSSSRRHTPIRFGGPNAIVAATLSSVPVAANELDYIADEYRAHQALFTDLSAPTVQIDALWPEPLALDHVALETVGIDPGASILFEAFATESSTEDLLGHTPEAASELLQLGVWRAGLDAYAEVQSARQWFAHWMPSPAMVQRVRATITHNQSSSTVTAPYPEQDEASGIVSLEGETGSVTAQSGNSWASASDGAASGDAYLEKTGDTFFNSTAGAPTADYQFTATREGVHDIWVRCQSASNSNSIYIGLDGAYTTAIFATGSGWLWYLARQATLVSGATHTLSVAARDFDFLLDKIVVQPSGSDAPTGEGPAGSVAGTMTTGGGLAVRALLAGSSTRLEKNFGLGAQFQPLSAHEHVQTLSGFNALARAAHMARRFRCTLPQLSDTDRVALQSLEAQLSGRSTLVDIYPSGSEFEQRQHLMRARFGDALGYTHALHNEYSTTIELREV